MAEIEPELVFLQPVWPEASSRFREPESDRRAQAPFSSVSDEKYRKLANGWFGFVAPITGGFAVTCNKCAQIFARSNATFLRQSPSGRVLIRFRLTLAPLVSVSALSCIAISGPSPLFSSRQVKDTGQRSYSLRIGKLGEIKDGAGMVFATKWIGCRRWVSELFTGASAFGKAGQRDTKRVKELTPKAQPLKTG